MNDFIAARSQMAASLAFHIIFAAMGVALPLMMVIAEYLWQRTGNSEYLLIAKRWAKGTAILFVIGALTGTVLSFELGLLWPRFMAAAGDVIGMPFSMEGFAFFTEAIFLGIYLYGWNRVSPRVHLLSGLVVSISGLASAIFVTFVNGWMNTPTGFRIENGQFVDIHPLQAMLNPAGLPEGIHMGLAAYCATGFATAGIHAIMLLRTGRNRFHESAIKIAFTVGAVACLLQFVSGDALARMVAQKQPTKLASLEGQFKTETGAPLRIGGIPDENAHTTKYALEIPDGLSLLAFHKPHATIQGLDSFPREHWPNVLLVHISFQIMVGCGSLLTFVALIAGWGAWKDKQFITDRRALWLLVAIGPLGFVALESGWMVTELGRQPWIIQGILLTRDAVTSTTHLGRLFYSMNVLYAVLGLVVVWLMAGHVIRTPTLEELETIEEEGAVHAA